MLTLTWHYSNAVFVHWRMACPQGIKYSIRIQRQFIKPRMETGNKRDKISLHFLYSVTIAI